jgi:rubrerythrin
MKATIIVALLCALCPVAGFAQQAPNPQKQQAANPQKTIDNLNAAIQGEANASRRYTLFAAKADEEGYPQVAKLFRAAALAESIHQKNHEKVLRDLGLQPKPPEIENITVGTTRQNLEVPIKGEAQEQEEMYPTMVKEAHRENVPAAARSFTYALNTEAQHLKLFKNALAMLGHNPSTDYYVGRVSGDTVTKPTKREPHTKVD